MAALTIFSVPKAFAGHIGTIQRNALASWRRLGADVHVALLGDDPGVADAAREFGARHLAELSVNRYGTPLVSDAFERMRSEAQTPFLMYTNADMLYDASIVRSLHAVANRREFLMSGQRWDTDITEDLCASDAAGWQKVFSEHASRGRLHGPAGMDYFMFPRAMPLDMPEFAVGRPGWDSWLVWSCLMRGVPVINATRSAVAIHQNHGYSHQRLGSPQKGPERDLNIHAAGGLANMLTLREAPWHLIDGQLRRPPLSGLIPSMLGRNRLYQRLLALKRSA